NAAASTALPHPPKTSQNVPRNSAVNFARILDSSPVRCRDSTSETASSPAYLRKRTERAACAGFVLVTHPAVPLDSEQRLEPKRVVLAPSRRLRKSEPRID